MGFTVEDRHLIKCESARDMQQDGSGQTIKFLWSENC